MRTRLVCGTLWIACASASAANQNGLMTVEEIRGVASVQRNGQPIEVQVNDVLQSGDTLRTDASGNVRLNYARYGILELGQSAVLNLDNIPETTFADSRATQFSVPQGYLRVLWKYPQLTDRWDIQVRVGRDQINLTTGEYFLQASNQESRICNVVGEITLVSDGIYSVNPGNCVRLLNPDNHPPKLPELSKHTAAQWLSARTQLSLDSILRPIMPTTATVALKKPKELPSSIKGALSRPAVELSASAKDLLSEVPGMQTSLPIVVNESSAPLADRGVEETAPTGIAVVTNDNPPIIARAELPSVTPRTVIKPITPKVEAMNLGDKSKSDKTQTWVVNFASSTEQSEAEVLLKPAAALGYDVEVASVMVRGTLRYRARAVGFASEPGAEKARKILADNLGINDVWVGRYR